MRKSQHSTARMVEPEYNQATGCVDIHYSLYIVLTLTAQIRKLRLRERVIFFTLLHKH